MCSSEGDWEASHFIMTGGAHGGDSPYLPTGLQDEVNLATIISKLLCISHGSEYVVCMPYSVCIIVGV